MRALRTPMHVARPMRLSLRALSGSRPAALARLAKYMGVRLSTKNGERCACWGCHARLAVALARKGA